MGYFRHVGREEGFNALVVIGDSPDEVRGALAAYHYRPHARNFTLPPDEYIERVDDLHLTCAGGIGRTNGGVLEVRVADDAILVIHEEMFRDIASLAQMSEDQIGQRQRGPLYKYSFSNHGHAPDYLISRRLVNSIRQYDWKQHDQLVERWLVERNQFLDSAEGKGVLRRNVARALGKIWPAHRN